MDAGDKNLLAKYLALRRVNRLIRGQVGRGRGGGEDCGRTTTNSITTNMTFPPLFILFSSNTYRAVPKYYQMFQAFYRLSLCNNLKNVGITSG